MSWTLFLFPATVQVVFVCHELLTFGPPGLVVASTACPFGKLLEVLGKSHTLEILYILGISSPQRFTRIQNDLELQPKALTARLQELVKFGLLTRKSYDEIPPRVDYEVSQKGRALGKMSTKHTLGTTSTAILEAPAERQVTVTESHPLWRSNRIFAKGCADQHSLFLRNTSLLVRAPQIQMLCGKDMLSNTF